MNLPRPDDAVLGNSKSETQRNSEALICKAWHSQDETKDRYWKTIKQANLNRFDFNRVNDLSAKSNQAIAYSKGLMDSYKISYGKKALNQLIRQQQRVWAFGTTHPEQAKNPMIAPL